MPDYEAIEPIVYQGRVDRQPRERYLHDHWHAVTCDVIGRYARGHLVLDLGCGFGAYAREIHHSEVVVGIDMAWRWLSAARSFAGLTRLVRADAHRLPLRDGVCDAVVSVGMLEFVDPETVISEIARVMSPGGYCVLVSSNKYSAFRLVLRALLAIGRRSYDRREPSRHELESALGSHGVRVEHVQMDDALIWLPDWLDSRIGGTVYRLLDQLVRPFGRNPFSTEMLIVGIRNGAR